MVNFNPSQSNDPIRTEKRGNFINQYVRWGCKQGSYTTLRKVVSVCIAIFLSMTILGLCLVIPAIREWKQQTREISQNGQSNKLVKESLLQTLAKFDNQSVKGQIYGIYITTNESNLDVTRQLLEKHPRGKQTIHIGCATWHNFDVMCTRKSRYGLIVDFNPKNAEFIKITAKIIKDSESRDAFKNAMITYLNSLKDEERNLYFHPDQKGLPTSRIENELSREGSWLQTEENYLFIKDLVSNDRLLAITETITNSKIFSKIRECLDANNIVVDTVYLSNICNFLKTAEQKQGFVKSIKDIANKDTILINCPRLKHSNSTDTTILHQTPLLGREILENSFDSERLFEDIYSKKA